MAKKSASASKPSARRGARPSSASRDNPKGSKPRLLSGGNPQVAKADGDAPVQAFIAAMPGWKREVGRRLDAVVTAAVPGVRKAVKWNSPFYGVNGCGMEGWFMSFHCYARYIKIGFFNGAQLSPPPPIESKQAHVRYLHVHEEDRLDEAQLADWAEQASRVPGWGA